MEMKQERLCLMSQYSVCLARITVAFCAPFNPALCLVVASSGKYYPQLVCYNVPSVTKATPFPLKASTIQANRFTC